MRARALSRSLVAACAALALSQTACGRKAFAEVPAVEVLARLEGDAAPLVLDVRTPAEFAAGHVPGALNISIEELARRVGELADHRDAEVVVYCERGPRAVKAAGLLADAGFASVRHLEGDMSGWRASGLPIDR
jgi:rhodanese-related sulfurtransferase